MKKTVQSKQLIGTLGEYKSIWDGVEDPLERELIRLELRKDHRRSMREIKKVVAVKYWIQILRWTFEDMRLYVPLYGGILLVFLLFLIALS